MPVAKGCPIHGEFSSSDASNLSENAARITLYGATQTSAVTLGSDDIVVITDLIITTGSSLTVTIYDGNDGSVGAGEVIFKGVVNGTVVIHGLLTPFYCQKGTYPHVVTSGAGQIDVQLRGTISGVGI